MKISMVIIHCLIVTSCMAPTDQEIRHQLENISLTTQSTSASAATSGSVDEESSSSHIKIES